MRLVVVVPPSRKILLLEVVSHDISVVQSQAQNVLLIVPWHDTQPV